MATVDAWANVNTYAAGNYQHIGGGSINDALDDDDTSSIASFGATGAAQFVFGFESPTFPDGAIPHRVSLWVRQRLDGFGTFADWNFNPNWWLRCYGHNGVLRQNNISDWVWANLGGLDGAGQGMLADDTIRWSKDAKQWTHIGGVKIKDLDLSTIDFVWWGNHMLTGEWQMYRALLRFHYSTRPEVSAVTVTGGTKPLVQWTYADDDEIQQSAARVIVVRTNTPDADGNLPADAGYDPETALAKLYDSGDLLTTSFEHRLTEAIPNNVATRVFVKAAKITLELAGEKHWSLYDSDTFTPSVTVPTTPTVTHVFADANVRMAHALTVARSDSSTITRHVVDRLHRDGEWRLIRNGDVESPGNSREYLDIEVPTHEPVFYRAQLEAFDGGSGEFVLSPIGYSFELFDSFTDADATLITSHTSDKAPVAWTGGGRTVANRLTHNSATSTEAVKASGMPTGDWAVQFDVTFLQNLTSLESVGVRMNRGGSNDWVYVGITNFAGLLFFGVQPMIGGAFGAAYVVEIPAQSIAGKRYVITADRIGNVVRMFVDGKLVQSGRWDELPDGAGMGVLVNSTAAIDYLAAGSRKALSDAAVPTWWLKSIDDPTLSQRVDVVSFERARERPIEPSYGFDRKYPRATIGTLRASIGEIELRALSRQRFDNLMALLESARVLLLQSPMGEQWYVLLGDAVQSSWVRAQKTNVELGPIRHMNVLRVPFIEIDPRDA